ncbi:MULTISPECIES: Crp/Fnr family transcriptional regulator [Azospirillum]|nr:MULTISPECIES: Crp/Fnr family transcriptional regulator [Azospirillum]
MTAIAECPHFKGLDAVILAEVADRVRVVHFPAGRAILRKGDLGDAAYIIVSGRANVMATAGERAMQVNSIEPYDLVGEVAAYDGRTRTADIVAETDMTLFRIDRNDLWAVTLKHPAVAERAIISLCALSRRASEGVEDAALRDQRSRLARLLLSLSSASGLVEAITQQELAIRLGTQREAVARILRELRNRGMVSGAKGRLRLLNRSALEELANS